MAGVCAGLAAHLGWDPGLVRAGMAALTLAGGAGAVLYAWLWVNVPTAEESAAGAGRNPRSVAENFARYLQQAGGGSAGGRAAVLGNRDVLVGAALLLLAAAVVAGRFGVGIDLGMLIPVAAVAGGAVLAWSQVDASRRAELVQGAGANRAAGLVRLLLGLLLAIFGLLLIVAGSMTWDVLAAGMLASLAVVAGAALVLAPWAVKYWRELQRERSGRIREAERAEIAAHLHDSVLQTLALIQNRAGSEAEVARLARAQERELRQWLYADRSRTAGRLADVLGTIAAEVEDAYGHPVELVAVGEEAPGTDTGALAQAARAALLNAAQHAGGPISVYLECGPETLEVFIRDRGAGFDPDTVPEDRLGVRESIMGRMRRHGGQARIRSGAEGTEVHLSQPVTAPSPDPGGDQPPSDPGHGRRPAAAAADGGKPPQRRPAGRFRTGTTTEDK